MFTTALLTAATLQVLGGGSGLNVVVVVNQNSSNSLALGNYYCEMRQVPPENVFRMTNWTGGGAVSWTLSEFNTFLRAPLTAFLQARRLTNQADYVLLSMDIPYKIVEGSHMNSTTSALFYGFKTNSSAPAPGLPDSCSLPAWSSNALAGSESPFRSIGPGKASPANLMATMITASNLSLAKLTVYQGAISDESFPQETVYLAKSPDVARNIRYQTFDRAIFDSRIRGNYSMVRANVVVPPGPGPFLGLQTGWYSYSPSSFSFVPGAMADNLTSYGGAIFQNTMGHLNILSLLASGASGAYGTLDEPCAWLEKFPSAQNYFYQARGFTLAESYYQSVTNPYQGLLLGEPLAAPFALAPSLEWSAVPQEPLSGTAQFTLLATAASQDRPIGRLDLYTNGAWMRTLTNIAPAQGNRLTVLLDQTAVHYDVPAGASIGSVAAGLASAINLVSAQTKVKAVVYGDRIELRLTDRSKPAAQTQVQGESSQRTAPALSTHLTVARPTFLDTIAHGLRQFEVSGNSTNRWLSLVVSKTNGTMVTISATNSTPLPLVGFVQQLLDKVNAHPELSGPDGIVAEDLAGNGSKASFNLRARSTGWDAAQAQAGISAQLGVTVSPLMPRALDENVTDLQPRNHLYVSAGVSNLLANFSLNTADLGNGFHELTATASEGTHVQTHSQVALNVQIQNSPLEAVLTQIGSGSNAIAGGQLQFSVVANSPSVNRIELFSTGGLLSATNNTSNATFTISGSVLGLGLHPFYAKVQTLSGQTYRTETKWVRLGSSIGTILVSASTSTQGPTLTWQATPGTTYSILRSSSPAGPFEVVATLTPSGDTASWADPNPPADRQFYRVRSP